MNATTRVAHSHANQTDTPENTTGLRYIAADSVAGYVLYACGTDPQIAELIKEHKTDQVGADRVHRVLFSLALHIDDYGVSRVSQQRIAKDLGIHRYDVQNAQKVLEACGLIRPIEKTSKQGSVKRFIVLPDLVAELSTPVPQPKKKTRKVAGGVAGGVAGDPLHKEEEENIYPSAQKKSKSPVPDSRGKEEEIDPLVERCIEEDLKQTRTTAGRPLRAKMRQQYTALVATGRKEYPNAPDDPLLIWAIDKRQNRAHSPYLMSELRPDNCPTCKGSGRVLGDRIDDGGAGTASWIPCPVCRPANVTHIADYQHSAAAGL